MGTVPASIERNRQQIGRIGIPLSRRISLVWKEGTPHTSIRKSNWNGFARFPTMQFRDEIQLPEPAGRLGDTAKIIESVPKRRYDAETQTWKE
jgi:hypothetical protein